MKREGCLERSNSAQARQSALEKLPKSIATVLQTKMLKFQALVSCIVVAALLFAAPTHAVEIDDLVDEMNAEVDAIGDLSLTFPAVDAATSFPNDVEDIEDMADGLDLEDLDMPSDSEIDSASNEIDSIDGELDDLLNNDVQDSQKFIKKAFKAVKKVATKVVAVAKKVAPVVMHMFLTVSAWVTAKYGTDTGRLLFS